MVMIYLFVMSPCEWNNVQGVLLLLTLSNNKTCDINWLVNVFTFEHFEELNTSCVKPINQIEMSSHGHILIHYKIKLPPCHYWYPPPLVSYNRAVYFEKRRHNKLILDAKYHLISWTIIWPPFNIKHFLTINSRVSILKPSCKFLYYYDIIFGIFEIFGIFWRIWVILISLVILVPL